ncbi:MAG: phosphoribosylamine--glycine ligase [Actinomycetota bacterium]|nr:phosphoribosylamine--glycine ligase [Actinomycetota bacterium]
MRVLLLGSGGRESAMASALRRSPLVDSLVAAPGNPGIAAFAETVPVDPEDVSAVLELARKLSPDLVVVGPEAPLTAGVGDALRELGIDVFGPDAAAAQIEASKAFAKEVMAQAGVTVPRWSLFSDASEAIAFMDELGPPYVIKANGLAAGKGVVVTEDRSEAVHAIEERLVAKSFGAAGEEIVIEEFLEGQEVSLIAFTDGDAVLPCEPAQDYKRVFDDDAGPNTGGMGSYSPVPACPPDVAAAIGDDVLRPVVRALGRRAATPFVGALYGGFVLTSGGPRVLEFNARFGDPETQALLPRLESDFAEICAACARRELAGTAVEWSPKVSVTVVLASKGYPGSYAKGLEITGVERAAALDDVDVFHAGTALQEGRLVTSGGRVVAVNALGDTFASARALVYRAADMIDFEGKHLRSDIALRAEEATTERGDR